MHLIIKAESDEHHTNLPTVNEMAVILSDEYNQFCFYDIVICSHHIKDTQHNFLYIHFSHIAYISLQYSFFLYNDSD